ncbi:hypothetical protein FHR84_004199 [Actinopolyspora biskrensis]|uniref:Uncharacterized protein n=1 Tax=Actinopolyspora biskrensis TaxID=1470178 RepID=A0A852Z212_9ACTN|nr:hypothetical protein [Actinopolyspora biskrensis]NYH80831.1 hypothetical protein [Actinopolyspora biskrensis]
MVVGASTEEKGKTLRNKKRIWIVAAVTSALGLGGAGLALAGEGASNAPQPSGGQNGAVTRDDDRDDAREDRDDRRDDRDDRRDDRDDRDDGRVGTDDDHDDRDGDRDDDKDDDREDGDDGDDGRDD